MTKVFLIQFFLLILPLSVFAQTLNTTISEKQINQAQEERGGATILEKPSKEIEIIINALKINEYEFDLSGFNVVQDKTAIDAIIKGASEYYVIPQLPYGNDLFTYTVIFDKESRSFWVRKTGGFAGVGALYGPGYLESSGVVKKQIN